MSKQKSIVCSVNSCNSNSLQTDPPEFYSFPRDLKKCSLWVRRCNESQVSDLFRRYGAHRLSKRNTICSQHFHDSDMKDPHDKSQGLKKGAVPTTNFDSYDSESLCSRSDYDSATFTSESESQEELDSIVHYEEELISYDGSSDTSEEIPPVLGDDKLAAEAITLKKRLIESERRNLRLKRAIDKLKRQNRVYKKKLK